MRKSLILIVLFGVAAQNPPRVEAGAFATEVTQLLNHAQLVMQYIRQGEQLANEINMYADMVKNSRTLSAHNFGAIMNDITPLTLENLQRERDAAKAENVRLMSRIEKLEEALRDSTTGLIVAKMEREAAGARRTSYDEQIATNNKLLWVKK